MYQSILILLLAVGYSKCFVEVNASRDPNPSQCDYVHLLEQKLISESDPEKKGDFRERFDECIPVHEKWAIAAVKHLNNEQKRMMIDYHKLQGQYDDLGRPLAMLLSESIKPEELKEVVDNKVEFYSEIFEIQLNKMCSGFDGTLKDLSRIYELITGAETGDENVEEKIESAKILHETAKHVTFEWIIYARSCQLLKEQQKFLSEEVRSILLEGKGKKSRASKFGKFFGK